MRAKASASSEARKRVLPSTTAKQATNNKTSHHENPSADLTIQKVDTTASSSKFSFLKFCFLGFSLVNFLSAYLNPISDCDETFNYWEPTHLLLYGSGFQTWEYSPVYALRSYLYVSIHAFLGKLTSLVVLATGGAGGLLSGQQQSKILVFYMIRVLLGLFSAVCQTWLMKGVWERFGKRIGWITMLFLCFSSGMFNAVAGFLPSTFAMYFLTLTYGSWLSVPQSSAQQLFKYSMCIATAGAAVILGWPFCFVCAIPVAIDTLIYYGLWKSIKGAIKTCVVLFGFTIYVDRFFYRRLLITPLNLVLYNKGSGSELYGVESWTFYFKNMFLNFNLVFVLALVMPLIVAVHYLLLRSSVLAKRNAPVYGMTHLRCLIYVSPFHIWFTFFTTLPHKEERFLFVVYPLCCVAAAIALEYLIQAVEYLWFGDKQICTQEQQPLNKKLIDITTLIEPTMKRSGLGRVLMFLVLSAVVVLGLSRTIAMVTNYGAPLTVYAQLSQYIEKHEPATKPIQICVGKEWYRFPSSFFLPRDNVSLRFLKSDFSGLLPKPYENAIPHVSDATSRIPTTMNDENREEMDRYVTIDQCDYLVDLDLVDQKEEHFVDKTEEWEIVAQEPFLDNTKSPMITRAFYIPTLSEKKNTYASYLALRRK